MVYALPYQTEELLKNMYYQLRKQIDPVRDVIHIFVSQHFAEDLTTEDVYKKVLHLEGQFRSAHGSWLQKPVRVRVLNQL